MSPFTLDIENLDGLIPLYNLECGQSGPQPARLELDPSSRSVRARVDNSNPLTFFVIPVSPCVNGESLVELLSHFLVHELIDRVFDGYKPDYEDLQKNLTEDACKALEELERLVGELDVMYVCTATNWLGGSLFYYDEDDKECSRDKAVKISIGGPYNDDDDYDGVITADSDVHDSVGKVYVDEDMVILGLEDYVGKLIQGLKRVRDAKRKEY